MPIGPHSIILRQSIHPTQTPFHTSTLTLPSRPSTSTNKSGLWFFFQVQQASKAGKQCDLNAHAAAATHREQGPQVCSTWLETGPAGESPVLPGKIQFRATMFLTSFNNVQDIVWYNHHWVEDQKILQLGSKNKYLRIKKYC